MFTKRFVFDSHVLQQKMYNFLLFQKKNFFLRGDILSVPTGVLPDKE